jgi:hypothetical protein
VVVVHEGDIWLALNSIIPCGWIMPGTAISNTTDARARGEGDAWQPQSTDRRPLLTLLETKAHAITRRLKWISAPHSDLLGWHLRPWPRSLILRCLQPDQVSMTIFRSIFFSMHVYWMGAYISLIYVNGEK